MVNRLGDANLKNECELLGRADLNMAYKSQCEKLSRNITTIELRQELSSENEDIIKNIVTDLKSKHEEAIRSLEERISNLKIQLDGMSKRHYSQQSTIPRNIKGM